MLPRCHGFFRGLQDAGAEITSSPPGCPENNFWGDKGSQQEKTDSLATRFFFFFFFRIRGGSKWIHFQWRWVHYFVCLCGFSVGDLLLETWDSDEKKVWDQFVNLDFAKCKKIILWRRQSYLLNTLGCSPTQWPPGLLKHSWGDHGYQLQNLHLLNVTIIDRVFWGSFKDL